MDYAYQDKLEAFIQPLRGTNAYGAAKQVQSGRQVLAAQYTPLMREPTDIHSKDPATRLAAEKREAEILAQLEGQLPTDGTFMTLTALSHARMVRNWAVGGRGTLTSCNSFCGQASAAMGSKVSVSAFKLRDLLAKHGKEYAYVPSSSIRRPAYGDIYKAASFHMGVSLGFEGDRWVTAEGGQGGPASGFDIVKIKRNPWNPAAVEGWCDMGLFLGVRSPIPAWLVGAWLVRCGPASYGYRFDDAGAAYRYTVPPLGAWTAGAAAEAGAVAWRAAEFVPDVAPAFERVHAMPLGDGRAGTPLDTGNVALQGADAFSVTWHGDAGTERFVYDRFNSAPGLNERMTGTSGRGEAITAVRM